MPVAFTLKCWILVLNVSGLLYGIWGRFLTILMVYVADSYLESEIMNYVMFGSDGICLNKWYILSGYSKNIAL